MLDFTGSDVAVISLSHQDFARPPAETSESYCTQTKHTKLPHSLENHNMTFLHFV